MTHEAGEPAMTENQPETFKQTTDRIQSANPDMTASEAMAAARAERDGTPEERGTIADAPSNEELDQYRDHMEDRDAPAATRGDREEGFTEGWTRAYYLLTNLHAAQTPEPGTHEEPPALDVDQAMQDAIRAYIESRRDVEGVVRFVIGFEAEVPGGDVSLGVIQGGGISPATALGLGHVIADRAADQIQAGAR